MALTVERIPPPAACSSSYEASPAVQLDHVPGERTEVAHPTHLGDPILPAQDVGVLDHVEPSEVGAAQGRVHARGRDGLRQVADEKRRHWPGNATPCAPAASSASS